MEHWDAVETASRIRKREVSPREVIRAAIARAEAAESLGAVVTATFERALDDADRAKGPFAGVPTFVKDLAHVAGVPIGWGTRAVRGVVSRRSDRIARVMADIGLVSLGKSAAPEFGLTATTEPIGRAPCRNPWDLARSSGGSSGGAASLVAAGVVPIAHASDGGGSIRIPASSTGLVGLKPSRGRLDMAGSALLPVNIAVDGVLTRTVRDTIAFWEAIDAITRPKRPIGPVPPEPPPLRIAVFVESPIGTRVSAHTTRAVERTADLCASLGHHVDRILCPFDVRSVDDFVHYWSFVAWTHSRLGRLIVHPSFDRTRLEPWTTGLASWCEDEPARVAAAIARLRFFDKRLAKIMAGYDVILSPVVAGAAPQLGHLSTELEFHLALERVLDQCPFTGLVNAAGACAMSLPLGRDAAGLPIGVHVAGRPGDDRLLLSLALQLEQASPWPTRAAQWPMRDAERATISRSD